jgi:exodeoxyribonuclease VII small subunit
LPGYQDQEKRARVNGKEVLIMSMKEISKLTFEEALQRLGTIIETMEQAEPSLDESLRHFEEGMELTRHCRKLLTEAEQKVEMILQNGELVELKEVEEA